MPLTQEQRDELNRRILEKMNDTSVIDDARQTENQSNLISNLGEAAEGMMKARSMAVGGAGVDTPFFNKFREQAGSGVEDAAQKRSEQLKAMMFARKNQDDQLAEEKALEQQNYSRGRDEKRDLLEQDKIKALREKPTARENQNRYEIKVDPYGRAIKLDRLTGETEYLEGSASKVSKPVGSEMEDLDAPPAPVPGETRQQYTARVDVWKAGKNKKETPLNATQEMARTFARRMEEAENVFGELSNKGFDRASFTTSAQSMLPDSLKSEDFRMQDQAERNFINAAMRRESGAAISPTEFDSAAKQYFPKAGDSAKVIEQKRRNRQIVIDGLKEEGRLNEMKPQAQTQPMQPQVQQQPQVDEEDRQAYEWAKQNPNDPRAQAIINHLSGK